MPDETVMWWIARDPVGLHLFNRKPHLNGRGEEWIESDAGGVWRGIDLPTDWFANVAMGECKDFEIIEVKHG